VLDFVTVTAMGEYPFLWHDGLKSHIVPFPKCVMDGHLRR
jgi:hypothetical protein